MSVRTYNPSVRVGNWPEDIELEEAILKDFLERRERGELLIQKSGKLRATVSETVDLSVSKDGKLRFGDKVMILNKITDEPPADNVLSINISPSDLHLANNLPRECGVSGSKNTKPSARNVFVITRPEGVSGDVLAYGEPFYLCTGEDEDRLYLHSESATFAKASKHARHNDVTLVSKPSIKTKFQALHFDPRLRMEYEHTPVLANTKVIINHMCTNQNLAVEQQYKLKTPFGLEYELSTHTYHDCHRAETAVNHFSFVCQMPGYDVAPQLCTDNSG